jgi:predicted regulator of Ras-like GTPase activity (Roadblock/LC7/MglB family)
MLESTILADLRDIDKVTGSFILSLDGAPKVRDLPSLIQPEVLVAVGGRVKRLLDAFAVAAPVEQCTIKFDEHRLVVRRAGPFWLCVLATNGVNVAAMDMATTLAAKQLSALDPAAIEQEPHEHPPDRGSVSAVPPQAEAPHRSTPKMVYRGRVVD